MNIVGNFIGGKVTHSASSETIPVYDPATGKVVRELTQSTADEVAQAIEVAHNAFPAWSQTSPLRRARVMFNFKALLEKHRDELAALIVSEHGKVWSDAQGELTRGLEVVVRLRHSAPDQRRVFAERRHRRRQLFADAAAGSGGGHYPI